jgi:CheY-like chemotaxis protein
MSDLRTILIADDDENDVFFLKRLLDRAGEYRLQIVHDGNNAIRYLAGEGEFADRTRYPAPCCVILDLKLPKKDGLEILEWMQTHKECAGIPALVCSGLESSDHIERALELGAFSFSAKPADPLQVSALLASMI